MGSDFSRCFSNNAAVESKSPPPTATVITASGDLRRYAVPVTVSAVLAEETASSPSWFLSNSDELNYGELVPESAADEDLKPNQIYFILARSEIQRRLSADDMAAMALKASAAIDRCRSKDSRGFLRRRNRARISPAAVSGDDVIPVERNEKSINLVGDLIHKSVKSANIGKPTTISRSGSVRRFQKYTRRVKSNRLKLSTIQEETTL